MFTEEEIEIIFNALDALEKESGITFLISSMMGAALLPDKSSRDEFLNEQKLELHQKENDEKVLKENIILLKAKLIKMKDKAFIDNLD